ncbi:hypothetical protein [Paenibacillus taiwanensis]|uniref:hypothetical protein n=1 Tax=Paenibacillus taiwanensis TaxID=401638 RepID=UPI001B7FBF5E|nr:hypothetical protein [Paenibacillus taiwanensis]
MIVDLERYVYTDEGRSHKNGQLKPGYDVHMATVNQLKVGASGSPFSSRSKSTKKVGRKTLRFSAQLFILETYWTAPYFYCSGSSTFI